MWKALIMLAVLIFGFPAMAVTYKEALAAYSEQKFSKCYRLAIRLSDSHEGSKKAKSLILAALAALEMNKEEKALKLFKNAIDADPYADLPDLIKSKRVQQFFADARSGNTRPQLKGDIIEVVSPTAYDGASVQTYLPFGINQFLQGKAITGMILGGGQIAALYTGITQRNSAARIQRKLSTKTVDVLDSGDYGTSQFQDFQEVSAGEAKKATKTSNLAFGAAALLYTASVLEIIVNPPMELKVVQTIEAKPTFVASAKWDF